MDYEGAYMHSDEILRNYRSENHINGSSYIELQPGLSVSVRLQLVKEQYMHLDEILKNYKSDNHVNGSSYIELQPGLSVSVVTAEHLNAVDVCKKFPSCNNHVCFNCQLQGKLQMQIKDRHFSTHKGDLIFGFTGGENFCLQHSDDFCNKKII